MKGNPELVNKIHEYGYKINVRHYRKLDGGVMYLDMNTIKVEELQDLIDPFGGYTECTVFWDEKPVFTVTAKCSPKDRFNRKIGAHIALARAYKKIEDPKVYSMGAEIAFEGN